jgi:hypothetical protein
LWAAYHGEEFRHHSGDEAGLWFHWLYSSEAVANGVPNVSAAIFYDPLGAAMLMVVGVVSVLRAPVLDRVHARHAALPHLLREHLAVHVRDARAGAVGQPAVPVRLLGS